MVQNEAKERIDRLLNDKERHEKKIDKLKQLLDTNDKLVHKQREDFEGFMCNVQNMFTIPGVIGADKQRNAYPTVTKLLKDLYEFKENNSGDMVRIMDSKITSERKSFDEKLVAVENNAKELLEA